MAVAVLHEIGMSVIECPSCGAAFGVSELFECKRRDDHRSFFCPNGHSMSYTGKSEAEKLKQQLTREQERRAALQANLDQTQASLRSTKGVVTKLKKRATAGVCPAGCRRHFENLERHMASQHPDFKDRKGA